MKVHGGPLLDGRIVVAGSVNGSNASPSRNFGLVRYLANGTVDLAGVQTDFFGYDDYINAVVVQPDEKVVAAGCATQVTGDPCRPRILQMAMARYHPDGSLDLSFGHEGNGKVTVVYGGADSCIFALAIQPVAGGGFKLVVAGYSGPNFRLVRYFDTGSSTARSATTAAP